MNCISWCIEQWSQLATIIGVVGAFIGAWLAYGQLKLIKKANYAAGFIKATELLQDETARKERAYVYKKLANLPFEKWTEKNKIVGEKVCQKFDTVGAMAAHEIITWDMAMHWRNTVTRTWKILEPLVKARREKGDIDFWDDYEIYAKKAEADIFKSIAS